ncbi:exportin-6-like [Ruditapes philippinarum]|nr:exportin-6-like [Ruditapes philippinarum]
MLSQFMNVLLQVLVHKSHDLLQEEIVVTIYNMASVDFDRFYSEFLPHFLTGCDGLDNGQKHMLGQNFKVEKDLPTFTQNLQRFVNDLRYYRLMNTSLPAGSVQFS